jgi:hypothetical protein
MGCPECDRLWIRYGGLIRDQMVVFAEYTRALRDGDRERVRDVNGAMEGSYKFF